jgi:hypothetical protein
MIEASVWICLDLILLISSIDININITMIKPNLFVESMQGNFASR